MSKPKKLKNIEPIKEELRPLMEEFVNHPEYQDIFLAFAKHMGYVGNDMSYVRKILFVVKNGQLGFNISGMSDLFLEFQLLKQLSDKEPYKTLLEAKPGAITQIRELSKRILNGDEITQKDLEELFKVETENGEEKSND